MRRNEIQIRTARDPLPFSAKSIILPQGRAWVEKNFLAEMYIEHVPPNILQLTGKGTERINDAT